MNINKNIFDGIKSFLGVTAVVTAFVVPAFAASDGCDNEKNDRIVAELALCSTHVYNIGGVSNPTNESDKQLMRDVVALKTTVMTQQMKKQYDYLDATIRRFKTQLEKAVLTTKLQAAGAGSSNDGSSSGRRGMGNISGDQNNYLAGTQNCNNMSTTAEVYTCLRSNYNLIYNMSNGGTNISTELRKQLANDAKVAATNADNNWSLNLNVKVDNQPIDCQEAKKINSRAIFQGCLNALNIAIRKATGSLAQPQQQPQQQQPQQQQPQPQQQPQQQQ